MKNVLIYGDSNTYGYDPRAFSDGRYPKEDRWTTILQNNLKDTHKIIADGVNGRPLPVISGTHLHLQRLFSEYPGINLFILILGTNDILLTTNPDAQVPINKLDHFLTWLKEKQPMTDILVIAPAYIGDGVDRYYEKYHQESILMNRGFEEIAKKHHVRFADASKWNVQLAYDQVHISPEGCKTFAAHMTQLLTSEDMS